MDKGIVAIFVVVLFVAIFGLSALVVMWLWNALALAFELPMLKYWMSLCIICLLWILSQFMRGGQK